MAANHSITSSVFLNSAQDLVRRLSPDVSPAGIVLAQEARALVEIFLGWERSKPADDLRIATIQRLFELNRRAMDHLAKTAPSSGVRTATIPGNDD